MVYLYCVEMSHSRGGQTVPKGVAKRQIILPVASCDELGIQADDAVAILRHGNQITIIKKETGAVGIL